MNDADILACVRRFLATVSARYAADGYYDRLPLNTFWMQQNLPLMRDIIAGADGPLDVVQRAQQTFMFSVNVATAAKQRAVDWLLAEQGRRGIDLHGLPEVVQESEFSYAENNVMRGARRLTPDFIRTVNIGLNIERLVRRGGDPLNVVELGGGLGHLARTLRLLGITRSHLIVDVPETLVFSYCFLTLNFPGARMLLVADDASADEIAKGDYDFAFVPALFSGAVPTRSYDLFVNTASLGEMRNEVIRYWMDFLQNRLDVRSLYTLNRYLNTIDPGRHAWRLAENECSVHYDRRWEILQWELEPSFTRCPYVDPVIARYVEIAAARLPAADRGAYTREADRLLRLVQEEDWYVVTGDAATMTLGDHVIGCDLGLTGTLFKLWNVLRLEPSASAVETMLRYLDRMLVREDRIFEEQPYYEGLFFALFDPARDARLGGVAQKLEQRRRIRARRSPAVLIESTGSFNIIQAGDEVVAAATAMGQIKLFEERLGERSLPPLLFVASTPDEARRHVAGLESFGAGVIEMRHDFNILWAKNGFFGLRQSAGNFDINRWSGAAIEDMQDSSDVVFGEQITTVREKIDVLEAKRGERERDAIELVGSWKGYNLVRHRGRVVALLEALGEIDVAVGVEALVERHGAGGVIVAESEEDARARIDLLALTRAIKALDTRLAQVDARLSEVDMRLGEVDMRLAGAAETAVQTRMLAQSFEAQTRDEFLGIWKGHNILRYRGTVIALSQGLGEVDISVGGQALVDHYGPDKVILAETADGARARIDLLALAGEVRDVRERLSRTVAQRLRRALPKIRS